VNQPYVDGCVGWVEERSNVTHAEPLSDTSPRVALITGSYPPRSDSCFWAAPDAMSFRVYRGALRRNPRGMAQRRSHPSSRPGLRSRVGYVASLLNPPYAADSVRLTHVTLRRSPRRCAGWAGERMRSNPSGSFAGSLTAQTATFTPCASPAVRCDTPRSRPHPCRATRTAPRPCARPGAAMTSPPPATRTCGQASPAS
jgi:hypothetical protein